MDEKQQYKQLSLHLTLGGKGEALKPREGSLVAFTADQCAESLVDENWQLMERVVERENLRKALKRVKSNKGSAGIDGMTVEELPVFLKKYWLVLKEKLLEGTYQPKPVRRVEIPKPSGGVRKLGIPCVLDRFIQQALLQVLQEQWDETFSENSYGFRPGRSAHQAVKKVQEYQLEGYRWTVDIDLEKFFDRVNHDRLMSEIAKRVSDKRVLKLIRRYLEAGVMEDGLVSPSFEGTPQGGPLSPILSNLVLDELDRELERRGHRFARYADDCNVYVRSKAAGERVMKSLERFITRRLKLKVNKSKSAVARPWKRKFLGFSFTSRKEPKRKLAKESLKRFKARIRKITRRTRGRTLKHIIEDLNSYLKSWMGYFGIVETSQVFKDLDKWMRRRLRCYLWKQWGRKGYRMLRKLGIEVRLAWHTSKSAHGPWRLSLSPALCRALNCNYFKSLGLIRLVDLQST